jgi:hypothetical protein
MSNACTINIINNASRSTIGDSRVMLQSVITYVPRGIIYDRDKFIVQTTVDKVINILQL